MKIEKFELKIPVTLQYETEADKVTAMENLMSDLTHCSWQNGKFFVESHEAMVVEDKSDSKKSKK
jgi:hypothetical protein